MPREGLNVFYVGFNNNPKNEGFDNSTNPFANEKVRQAVAMGINRDQIVSEFYPPGSEVAIHYTVQHRERLHRRSVAAEFDATAAKALLAEAGYPDGFQTKLSYRPAVRGYLPDPPAVAQAIQAQLLANLGIDATLDPQDDTTYLDTADAGLLDGMHLLGWGADYPDMTNFLDYHRSVRSVRRQVRRHHRPSAGRRRRCQRCARGRATSRPTMRSSGRTCRWSRSPTAGPAWPTRPT